MPELPEVETIARSLRDGIYLDYPQGSPLLGAVITGARLLWPRTLAEPDFPEFRDRIIGQQLLEIGRRGKYLCFRLDADVLLIHLRMSGDIRVRPRSEPDAPHDRLVLDLGAITHLAFNDTRKFGRVWLVEDPETVLGKLGPEPFDPQLTEKRFAEMLNRRKRQIKPLLLDQTFLAGLGNIYTDEALHLAGIHPRTLSDSLSSEQAGRLFVTIREVLQAGIENNGSSIDWVYRGGEFQNHFQVYGRGGEPCYRCGTALHRELIGQRSTHFCPRCQPRKE